MILTRSFPRERANVGEKTEEEEAMDLTPTAVSPSMREKKEKGGDETVSRVMRVVVK